MHPQRGRSHLRVSLWSNAVLDGLSFVLPAVYQALYLDELTLLDLSEKIAMLYSITPQQITRIYRQKANGIHVLVSDEVSHLPINH